MNWSPKQLKIMRMPFSRCLEVNEGTPRSGKTTASVFRYARHMVETDDINHLVVAFNQEQAYKLIMECDGFGLLHVFDGCSKIKHDDNGDHLEIVTPKGTRRVYYKGGGKADSHKSITGLSLGSVYFCEIDLLHMNMVQECFRRTFAAKNRWHIADLNPPAPQHPVIKEVFDVQDTYWQHWTIDDNPIITPERKEQIRQTLIKNPYLYARDWEGRRTIPQGVIYSMFNPYKHAIKKLPENAKPLEMFFAGDGGLQDATSIGCYVIARMERQKDDKQKRPIEYRLYRMANWYYSGADTGRVLAMSLQAKEITEKFMPYCRNLVAMRESCVLIDPACKALRSELELFGVDTDGADNNAHDIRGSTKGIRVGIEYLQSSIEKGLFYLVECEKFGHYDFLREVGLYCVDDHGNPVDAYNHAMDECRYANNYFYKNYVL